MPWWWRKDSTMRCIIEVGQINCTHISIFLQDTLVKDLFHEHIPLLTHLYRVAHTRLCVCVCATVPVHYSPDGLGPVQQSWFKICEYNNTTSQTRYRRDGMLSASWGFISHVWPSLCFVHCKPVKFCLSLLAASKKLALNKLDTWNVRLGISL